MGFAEHRVIAEGPDRHEGADQSEFGPPAEMANRARAPRNGEKPRAAAIAIVISAIARPSAAPLKRSRAIARDSTEVEHAPAA